MMANDDTCDIASYLLYSFANPRFLARLQSVSVTQPAPPVPRTAGLSSGARTQDAGGEIQPVGQLDQR